MLDEQEFFGPHGIRALSRYHLEHPYVFHHRGQEFRVSYLPGDSDSGMFGDNSNWRGPVWMPVNLMLYSSLLRLAAYYGDAFTVECPTGSGRQMPLFAVAHELAERLIGRSCATAPDGGQSMAAPRSSRPIRTGVTTSCSTSTSMATTGPASAPATRPDGRGLLRASSSSMAR
jgi:hypothetical protein